MIYVIIFIIIIIAAVIIQEKYKSAKKEKQYQNSELARKFNSGEYEPTTDKHLLKYVSLDENNHLFTFGHDSKIYNYDQLVNYELIENNKTVFKSSGGIKRAVVGSILAGGVGAVIGASTAKHSATEKSTNLEVVITIKPGVQLKKIVLIDSETNKDSLLYKNKIDLAEKIISNLKVIEQYNQSRY